MTSNLVHSFIWAIPMKPASNFPEKRHGHGHLTLKKYGTPSNIHQKQWRQRLQIWYTASSSQFPQIISCEKGHGLRQDSCTIFLTVCHQHQTPAKSEIFSVVFSMLSHVPSILTTVTLQRHIDLRMRLLAVLYMKMSYVAAGINGILTTERRCKYEFFRSRERKFHRVELSLPGTFIPWNFRS